MPLLNIIYNKYHIQFQKINKEVLIWLHKNNKNYDSMMLYGLNIYKEFVSFAEKYELFYDKNNDTFSFYIYGENDINSFYDDLYVFMKRYEAFIF